MSNSHLADASQPVPLYDALAGDYDRFVNWPGRLAHELPFFTELFSRHAIRRVLDTACGTGQHAIALAQLGYQVSATDLSAAMIERAREHAHRAGVEVGFAVAGLGEHAALGQKLDAAPWDAALCLGNSLPHLLTTSALDQALADFASVLRPGGILVVQNRNLDRVWAERDRFMEPQTYRGPEGEWVFVRFYDFHDETITFNMIRLHRTEGGWQQTMDATELRPILRDDLVAALSAAGFQDVAFYGGYDRAPFDPAQSGDLIAVAKLAS